MAAAASSPTPSRHHRRRRRQPPQRRHLPSSLGVPPATAAGALLLVFCLALQLAPVASFLGRPGLSMPAASRCSSASGLLRRASSVTTSVDGILSGGGDGTDGTDGSSSTSTSTSSSGSASRAPSPAAEAARRSGRVLQVITDIDDTVKSSGGLRLLGVALGGIDTQYRRGQYYPGAFQFAFELSRFGVPEGREPQRIAVLTARAREFKFALELKPSHKVCRTYAQAGVENGAAGWGVGTVLYGSVKEWICQSRKGLRKFRNFEALRAEDRFDLTDYVFIGDTGELDQQAGESMIRKYPTRIKGLFMHFVSEERPAPPCPRDRRLLDVPILYFKTYVGAAVKAAGLGLLDAEGVQAVVDRTLQQLETAEPPATPEQWEDVLADIELAKRTVLAPPAKQQQGQGQGQEAGAAGDAPKVLRLVRKLFRPPDTRLPARRRA